MARKIFKRIILLVSILGLLACVGCKGNSETTEEQLPDKPSENQFDAKVLEVHDEYLMVEAMEGQTVAGEVQVWTGLLSEDEIPELEKDVVIRITHDGKMTMSIPPQMSAVEEIIILQQSE